MTTQKIISSSTFQVITSIPPVKMSKKNVNEELIFSVVSYAFDTLDSRTV